MIKFQPGLLICGQPTAPRLPAPIWAVASLRSFVPADSGGAMPDSHRLPVTETPDTAFFLSIALALVHPSKIDLLEAEALKQFHGRLIALDGLHLHQAEILFLQVA